MLPPLLRRGAAGASDVARIRTVLAAGERLETELSTNPQNDEDEFIFPPGLRERLNDLFGPFGSGPPFQPAYDLKDRLNVQMTAARAAYESWRAQADEIVRR
jgi:hypothetical protein